MCVDSAAVSLVTVLINSFDTAYWLCIGCVFWLCVTKNLSNQGLLPSDVRHVWLS